MKLNIEKYSDIISLYPSFVSHQFRKIFTEDTKSHALKTILECFEILLNHLTFFALCQLIHLCKTNSNFVDTKLKEKVISRLIHKFSLGSKVEIFRDLLMYFKSSENEGIFLEFLDKKEDVKDFFEKASLLVTFRNDLEHKKIQLTDENEDSFFSEYFPYLESLILDCSFFRNIKILLPIETIRTDIKFLEFAGASQKPLIRRVENIDVVLENNKCHIGNLNGSFIVPAHPFWQYSLIKDEYLLLFGQFDDDKKVILSENFKGTSLIDKGAQLQVFLEAIQPLYPDYKYQSNPYLSGYDFLILNHKLNLKLLSPDGDIETNESINFIKIKYYENSKPKINTDLDFEESTQDYIPFGYHDAPLYPISDELFNLKARNEKGEDLEAEYDIHNEGFRDFKIGVNKIMSFEEKDTSNLSYSEPMLFSGFLEDNEDYYEIDIEQPIKLFELNFELIQDYEFSSFEIKYSNKEFPKKKIINNKIGVNSKGNSYLYLSIKEPEIGKTFIIDFHIRKTEKFRHDYIPKKDSFRTGLNLYKWIKNHPAEEYEILEESDGSIRIIPKK